MSHYRHARSGAAILAAALMMSALAACGGAKDTLSGDSASVLASVLQKAQEGGAQSPISETFAVTAENSHAYLGLTADEFNQYVENATVSHALITTSPHEIALIKAKDASSAARVKELTASGFDSGKWICVSPDVSLVIDSGSYVLLAVSYKDYAPAVQAAFVSLAGDNTGEAVVFFTKPEDDPVLDPPFRSPD